MIIKIPVNAVKDQEFGMLNSEPLIASILNYEIQEEGDLKVILRVETENSYLNNLNKNGAVEEFSNILIIPLDEGVTPNSEIHVIKLVKDYLESLELTGLELLAEAEWQITFGANVTTPRDIRVTIPEKSLIDQYSELLTNLKAIWSSLGISVEDEPYKKDGENRIVYLEEIDSSVETALNADDNILIEYKQA